MSNLVAGGVAEHCHIVRLIANHIPCRQRFRSGDRPPRSRLRPKGRSGNRHGPGRSSPDSPPPPAARSGGGVQVGLILLPVDPGAAVPKRLSGCLSVHAAALAPPYGGVAHQVGTKHRLHRPDDLETGPSSLAPESRVAQGAMRPLDRAVRLRPARPCSGTVSWPCTKQAMVAMSSGGSDRQEVAGSREAKVVMDAAANRASRIELTKYQIASWGI